MDLDRDEHNVQNEAGDNSDCAEGDCKLHISTRVWGEGPTGQKAHK